MDFSFKGGLEGASYNAPSAFVVYIKERQLVIADRGQLGEPNSAWFDAENWMRKITANMGYLLLFAGLVHDETKPLLHQVYAKIAKDAGLELVIEPEWQG